MTSDFDAEVRVSGEQPNHMVYVEVKKRGVDDRAEVVPLTFEFGKPFRELALNQLLYFHFFVG